MVFACEACGTSFNSDRGRLRHQSKCEEFLLADNEASTVDNALEKYRRKLQRKKHKAALSKVSDSESLTGSGVRDFFHSYFYPHHSSFIVGCILGYRHGRYRRESHIGTGTGT